MDVPLDVLKIVASYITKHKMKLLDWINMNGADQNGSLAIGRIDWHGLSENPNAIHLLETNQHYICW